MFPELVLNTWSKKPRTFCFHFLRYFSRCCTASWVSMKMKRLDQRYSHGSSARAARTPGADSSGKPSMATTWMKLRPIFGTTPPQSSLPPMTESRYIGLLGNSIGWLTPVTQNCSQLRKSSWVICAPSSVTCRLPFRRVSLSTEDRLPSTLAQSRLNCSTRLRVRTLASGGAVSSSNISSTNFCWARSGGK
ncbi:hypothetical protein D9M71_300590 [compost metagenome]